MHTSALRFVTLAHDEHGADNAECKMFKNVGVFVGDVGDV